MNLENFINTLKQLKGDTADFEIAVSNIHNLEVDSIYKLLFAKELTGSRRRDFIKEFPTVDWPGADKVTYQAVYHEGKNRNLEGQEEDTYLLSTNINNSIIDINTFDFIDNIKVKLKW